MGMYDTIICEYPGIYGSDFQTKSFDCTMTTYCIDQHGGLWYLNNNGDKAGHFIYNGTVVFYTYLKDPEFNDDYGDDNWIEYEAKFSRGKLKSLKTICLPKILAFNQLLDRYYGD